MSGKEYPQVILIPLLLAAVLGGDPQRYDRRIYQSFIRGR